MGAITAVQFAYGHPERVRTLVQFSVPPVFMPFHGEPVAFAQQADLPRWLPVAEREHAQRVVQLRRLLFGRPRGRPPGAPIRGRAGRLTGMGDRGEQPAWAITMPSSRTGVQVVMSGALGPAAHLRMRDILRVALLSALSPEPRPLNVLLTAVTSCDEVLPGELHELAANCARENIPLRIDVAPALLPLLGSAELAPFLHLADSTAASESAVAVVPTWVDRATLVIAVAGELDLETTPRMRDGIAVILAARPLRLVLDLLGVRFLASTGVNEIIRLAHIAADDAMTLHVAAGEHNRQTFELLGLADTILRVFDTRAQALAAFTS